MFQLTIRAWNEWQIDELAKSVQKYNYDKYSEEWKPRNLLLSWVSWKINGKRKSLRKNINIYYNKKFNDAKKNILPDNKKKKWLNRLHNRHGSRLHYVLVIYFVTHYKIKISATDTFKKSHQILNNTKNLNELYWHFLKLHK